MGGIRSALIHVGLFALGVTIGLGYVHASRPHQAELPRSMAPARALESAREVIIPGRNGAASSDGVEGPASVAFATTSSTGALN